MNTEQISLEIMELKKMLQSMFILQKEQLTLEEAALYLGISKSTLYKLSHTKSIPFYKPGNKLIYFKRADLDNWVCQAASRQGATYSGIPSWKRNRH